MAYTPEHHFIFDSSMQRITGYNEGIPTDISIPPQIGGVDVLSIGQYAFQNSEFTSITIHAPMMTILTAAFRSNTSLVSLTLPASLRSIETMAFDSCGLSQIIIPKGVNNVGWHAFRDNPLTDVLLGDNINLTGDNHEGSLDRMYNENNREGGRYYKMNDEWYFEPLGISTQLTFKEDHIKKVFPFTLAKCVRLSNFSDLETTLDHTIDSVNENSAYVQGIHKIYPVPIGGYPPSSISPMDFVAYHQPIENLTDDWGITEGGFISAVRKLPGDLVFLGGGLTGGQGSRWTVLDLDELTTIPHSDFPSNTSVSSCHILEDDTVVIHGSATPWRRYDPSLKTLISSGNLSNTGFVAAHLLSNGTIVFGGGVGRWNLRNSIMTSSLRTGQWTHGHPQIRTIFQLQNGNVVLSGTGGRWQIFNETMTSSLGSGQWDPTNNWAHANDGIVLPDGNVFMVGSSRWQILSPSMETIHETTFWGEGTFVKQFPNGCIVYSISAHPNQHAWVLLDPEFNVIKHRLWPEIIRGIDLIDDDRVILIGQCHWEIVDVSPQPIVELKIWT